MKFDADKLSWTREPASCSLSNDRIEIVTKPHTDLWQRTYYHFRNDNAPVLQMDTCEKYFSFTGLITCNSGNISSTYASKVTLFTGNMPLFSVESK